MTCAKIMEANEIIESAFPLFAHSPLIMAALACAVLVALLALSYAQCMFECGGELFQRHVV